MLKFPCLVLDHDDTIVQSEATINYPFFVEYLKKYREMSWEESLRGKNTGRRSDV